MSAWRRSAYRAIRPLLFTIDPERIHHAALAALSGAGRIGASRAACRLLSGVPDADAERSPVDLMGVRFRNRIGLGAGFDKDGRAIRGWAALGFGFVELGTVTPRPQAGNPRPRLFRLPTEQALVNRMGFNNAGADAVARRIAHARPYLPDGFAVGVNIGRNRETPDERAVDDYRSAASTVAGVADYLVVNVSSPNTPGLQSLQNPERLIELVSAVMDEARGRPVLVKVSSDLDSSDFAALAAALGPTATAGLVLSNTTMRRDAITSRSGREGGGLSGAPLLDRTVDRVRDARELGAGRFVIVASGGVGSAMDAAWLLEEGADLVQIWTGLIYAGPGLIGDAVRSSAMIAPS